MGPPENASPRARRDPPSDPARLRLWRWAELLLVFFGLPTALVAGLPAPRIPLLLLVTGACFAALWRDPAFDRARLWSPSVLRWAPRIVLRAAGIATLLLALTWILYPGQLFQLPRQRPLVWALVMVLYPALSAWPQEIVYRAFFLHRYRQLVTDERWLEAMGAMAFAYVHVVYGNALAVVLTLPAGLLFCRTYRRSGTVLASALEHGLYGAAVFTVGLGSFFYRGWR